MSYTVEDVTRLLDDSFQADSSEDDLGFEAEECKLQAHIKVTKLIIVVIHVHVVHV